jgi:hypothetical protein
MQGESTEDRKMREGGSTKYTKGTKKGKEEKPEFAYESHESNESLQLEVFRFV